PDTKINNMDFFTSIPRSFLVSSCGLNIIVWAKEKMHTLRKIHVQTIAFETLPYKGLLQV
ncbi:hypothetical protein J4G37_58330, partial [Microvirga sp. 3-52]|nr:hypothetical protein [Microvirga sp. 3-52]